MHLVRCMTHLTGCTPGHKILSATDATMLTEAIDTHLFSPLSTGKYELPPKDLYHQCNRNLTPETVRKSYTFLSDFKWEPRKGWDVLFESYFRAFTSSDNVVLFVLTHIWFPGAPDTYSWAHN
ncbi:Hypothetical protein, putative [Bodo saltans]|uniref:Uncharacterized protein n=1 Tax=Bodo saltans TaxID=75058 RepID=A0A0S4ISF5_BODSA|nr:Hypothetical protein, putative [Bodo saltans]|eukprot:CUF57498.1 Hypothetical protein, putative [Bodo saltans]